MLAISTTSSFESIPRQFILRSPAMSTDSYDHAGKMENSKEPPTEQLERQRTAGGHVDDRGSASSASRTSYLANPAPLGLLSVATGNKQLISIILKLAAD
jgi:hypothetical protein